MSVQTAQLTSLLYRKYANKAFTNNRSDSLVMIERTRKRKLVGHAEKADRIKVLAEKHGLKFEVFSDNPVPPYINQVEVRLLND